MEQKKVLIICYYWPPAGGPGVQRWLKFAKYLPGFNIEPVVYVPENANYPITDESLGSEVSEALTVLKQPIAEPYKLAGVLSKKSSKTISKGIISEEKKQSVLEKIMLFVRGNFFIPDARVGWVKPSVKFLSKYIEKEQVDTVITTGPPHSMHLIGLQLKEKLGVRWLADFRDPWTTIGYHKQLKLTSSSEKRHKMLENQVLNAVDQIIVTSYSTKTEFQSITDKPIEVITNGYDNEVSVAFDMDTKFTLSHIGSLLSKRNPEILWKALKELVNENTDFSKDFRLNFIGSVSENVMRSIDDIGLSDYINDVGYVSHKESVVFQKKSQLLLLVEINSEETKSIIPGKLFEYMVSNRPIIAVGPEQWDVKKIIKETNTGDCFSYDDFSLLKNTILEYYKAFRQGSLRTHPIGLQKYHRKALTESLSKLL
ncbi:glycosyltransferase family 4 protein [Tamlana haliotis]|uniref:Glycosyltransferase family 4 protein n=1 Tax=Pseudotamlana haliotis TaxID=2614804 RepID=A0A6N6MJS4_9FLAO|nr:glycosyltransferase family 4 protein [Tamlana haliotis]KAB1071410.1 glycosyltransferase family 4 protein [Tamlana haliotis]